MIGDKIKMLRISQGLNQNEFAQRLFVTPGAVSQWETGRSVPDTERLMAIARIFSVPLDFFSDDPNGKQYTETELIEQQLLIKLGAEQPKTEEAKILAKGIDKLPKQQREQALNVVRAMFASHPELFEKGSENDEA